jgi:hypothetical protein
VADGVDEVSVIQLERPFTFESPFHGDDFALLLVIAAPDITFAERKQLSEVLVAQGCRYAVCTGSGAGAWDDAIDFAAVNAELDGQRSSQRLIMTSWHENQPLSEVAEFFFNHTAFDDFVPTRRIALLLGGAPDALAAVRTALVESGGGPTSGCS